MSDQNKKIKVVWLCHFSNAFVHEKLDLQHNRWIGLVRRLAHKPVSTDVSEFGNWITNGIAEFEKFDDVELHIVSPYPNLKRSTQELEANGVYYHFFMNEEDSLITYIYQRLFKPGNFQYRQNCKTISAIISTISPDIVHLFGAENPYYALGILKVPSEIITIAQLQTLMNDPDFKKNYPIDGRTYKYRAGIEKTIIQKADYIGTPAKKYRDIIYSSINSNAKILNTGLALKDSIVKDECEKQYDFVFFAANINKAADLALEAFGLAYQQKPGITINVIGGYDMAFMRSLEGIIEKYGIKDAVTFEGRLPTHDDVLKHIRKSRFALLPLKIDLTSGTIREAMANGLPVVTTDTGEMGTQKLNLIRKNVLISPVGDHQALADNMLSLLEDEALADELRQNSFETRSEARSNAMTAHRYVDAYKACIDNKRNNKPLPAEVTEI